ncbi:MAG: alpha-glucan family phosphorylase [Planctomycetota bacterium]
MPPKQKVQTAYQKLEQLCCNLWWTWHPQVVEIFRALDAELWREVNHNPNLFLRRMGPERMKRQVAHHDLGERIDQALGDLQAYCSGDEAWALRRASTLRVWPVAYFSAEFGLHESIPTYAGGLGLLAGDHLKSCSDLGVPLVGIGLLYTQGYFHQLLDAEGMQHEEYRALEMENLPLEPVMTSDGRERLLVDVPLHGRAPKLQIWLASVGRIKLYLLDSNVPENDEQDRALTGRLYASDPETRIQQEIILGVGGVRTLAAVQQMPGALHLNEGHCAFALLEMIRLNMVWEGVSFDDARAHVGRRSVFTTHTPVPAGHDQFAPDLVERHLGSLRESLGLSQRDFLSLGRVSPDDGREPFCMTVLALRVCHRANGVASLHGHTSRKMWRPLWDMRHEQEVPIGHITNGVHVQSWLAPRMFRLYERCLGESWHLKMTEPETWEGIADVTDEEMWEVHLQLKTRLLDFVRRRTAKQRERRGESAKAVTKARDILEGDALTIGFARRFASYKRADLIFADLERLLRILCDEQHAVQIIFAGKAHPANEQGKKCIQRIHQFALDPRFKGRVAFIEDYDIGVGRHLVQGVDLWLNNPIRPLEACGTSGQKVLVNGGLNLSVLDGWWAEAYDGHNGFAIGHGGNHPDSAEQTRRDALSLYEVLEDDVIPMYFDRDEQGIPRRWLARVKWAIMSLGWRFNADRMVLDYFRECYLRAAGATPCDFRRYRARKDPL